MEVGTRLAWLALRNDYGVDGVPLPAPTYKSMEKEYNDYHKCNQLVLSFNNLSGQNEFNESDSILGFGNYPEDANVMTTSGQPFAPFRTDDWEVKDVGIIK